MTAPDPRTHIRQWWRDQLATGQPIDLDAATTQALAHLFADPAFVAAVAERYVKPLVREIGQAEVGRRPNARAPRPVQLGRTVMSRQQAIALVEQQVGTPHWSKLIQRQGEPQWFMALGRDDLMREATRRKDQGVERLKEATFLLAVANNLESSQIVADVWEEAELDALFDGFEVDVKARRGNVTFAFQWDKSKALGGKAS